jgi:GNAT superfamily N-acetyltransferase
MPTRNLPTGEEPPKGFESIVGLEAPADGLQVNCVLLSQLARIELTEIEDLRAKALSAVRNLTGLTNKPATFEREVNIISDRSASDKLLFRAYTDKQLVGYALVICGWPQTGDWTIQHLNIDPQRRGMGIGSTIVRTIEEYAASSEVAADNLLAIPVQKSGTGFWADMGYTLETGRHLIKLADLDHEIITYRKELAD